MTSSRWQLGSPVVTALLCSGVIGAQYVSGKVVRDALFLDVFDGNTALPWMTQATSLFSIFLVFATAAASKRVSPVRYVPIAFGVSAIALLACWAGVSVAPRAAAVTVYLQVSGLGPVLGSGFWLLIGERLDPRTAKRHFGMIAGAGTLGGLLTTFALAPSAAALLPILAVLNILCAALVWRLGHSSGATSAAPRSTAKAAHYSGFSILARETYLRKLALLVLLGTVGAIVMDYLFKTQVSATFGKNKLAFFKIYYPVVNTITFLLQTFGASIVLEKAGIATATALPSFTLLAGSLVTLVAPGLGSIVAVRGGESVFRGSLYRSGYEVFFTPVPAREKRAVKTTIDVGFDRFGDLVGAVFMQLALLLPAGQRSSVLLVLVSVCSAAGLLIASGLKRGYQQALEHSLVVLGEELELPEFEDAATRAVFLKTRAVTSGDSVALRSTARTTAEADHIVDAIRALRSNDNERIRHVLRAEKGPGLALVPHITPLLAWDDIAPECIRALQLVAEERIGTLTDLLVDPNQPFVVRRRLARVFFVCMSQRAADGMLLGLEDVSFEVRFRCGQSLFAIVEKNRRVVIERERILAIAEKEVAVSTDIWKRRTFVDESNPHDTRMFLDEVLRERSSQALEHVFRLLALVLPAEPLRVAFHGLHTSDQHLRGTALDYLDSVLPVPIKKPLWPFLEDRPGEPKSGTRRDDALAQLLQSHESIMLNLKELQKRKTAVAPPSEPAGI